MEYPWYTDGREVELCGRNSISQKPERVQVQMYVKGGNNGYSVEKVAFWK